MPHAKKVAVVGHSFVKKLKVFVEKDEGTDLNLQLTGAIVDYMGFSGLKLNGLEHRVKEKLERFKPDTVCLIIGENDIKSSLQAESLVLDIIKKVEDIGTWSGGASTIVCQLMPRYWAPSFPYFI